MPKFGALLNSLAGKAGIKTDDDTLKKLLAFVEVSQFDVPEEFNNALERNLLTADSATANSEVRVKIFGEALGALDAELDKAVRDFGFDDEFKNQYNNIQKNTKEKFKLVTSGLRTKLEDAKKRAEDAKKKAEETKDPKEQKEVETLKKEIDIANQQMANLKQMHQVELDNLKTANLNDKKDFTLKSMLAAKPLPKNGLAPEINILTAKTLIQQEMAKMGLQVSFDDAGDPILRQIKDGTAIEYFVDNKKIDYSSFIDSVLANNKFVQVNDQPPPTNQAPGNPQNQSNNRQVSPSNHASANQLRQQAKELRVGTAV